MQSILDTLNEKSIVFDGAMGTMLFSKGVFLNQCFDELNVSSPEIVTQVHEEYIRAGADVLTTNTFGANRIKLESFGMADRVGEINKGALNWHARWQGRRCTWQVPSALWAFPSNP